MLTFLLLTFSVTSPVSDCLVSLRTVCVCDHNSVWMALHPAAKCPLSHRESTQLTEVWVTEHSLTHYIYHIYITYYIHMSYLPFNPNLCSCILAGLSVFIQSLKYCLNTWKKLSIKSVISCAYWLIMTATQMSCMCSFELDFCVKAYIYASDIFLTSVLTFSQISNLTFNPPRLLRTSAVKLKLIITQPFLASSVCTQEVKC